LKNIKKTIYSELDDDIWAKMIFGLAELPPLPPSELQRNWCGNAGLALVDQSLEFYKLLKHVFLQHGTKPLSEAKILDFGCGWGRLIRLFIKDLPGNQLFGCDPDAEILKWCEKIPGNFRVSDYRPKHLPFDDIYDLVYAYSVFTHLGPGTHLDALIAIHKSLAPNGLLVITIRPRIFIENRGIELAKLPEAVIDEMLCRFDCGEFVFQPYNLLPVDGEVTYGEAVIPMTFIMREWSKFFDIIHIDHTLTDSMQIPIVLRKRSP